MKKIFTLLAVVMASLTAMAQTTFYGTWKNNSNSFPSFDNYVEVTVNDNGTSTIVLKNIVFGNDVLGTITLNNVSTEQNGNGYSFSMGSQTTFDITEGNMGGVTKGAFEGWGTMDGENLQLIANYFDYGTTSLRYVKFNGTKVQTSPTDPPSSRQRLSRQTCSHLQLPATQRPQRTPMLSSASILTTLTH